MGFYYDDDSRGDFERDPWLLYESERRRLALARTKRIIFQTGLWGTVLLLLFSAGKIIASEAGAKDHLSMAMLYLKDSDKPIQAVRHLDAAVSIEPEDPVLYFARGLSYERLKDDTRAMEDYLRAVRLKSDYKEAWVGLAHMYAKTGQAEDAVLAYRTALGIDPEMVFAWTNLGAALYEMNRYEESLSASRRAVSLKPDSPEALNNLGNSLRALQMYDEALSAYDRALQLRPDFVESLAGKAVTQIYLDKPGAALPLLLKASELEPDNPGLWKVLAHTYALLGRQQEAKDALRRNR